MALITDAGTAWSSPIVLSTDEIWQTRKGSVFITPTATPAANDGIALHEQNAVRLPAGASVRYRKEGTTTAEIVHEAV